MIFAALAWADERYDAACSLWQGAVREDRIYPADGECPGFATPETEEFGAWRAYQRSFDMLAALLGTNGKGFRCPVPDGQQPWQDCIPQVIALLGDEGSCTGVLVAPDIVLTAGHCVNVREAFSTNVLHADAGVPGFRAERTVARRLRHPELDLALLKLDEPLPFDPLVWPVTPTALPETVFMYGFGETAAGQGDFGTLNGGWFSGDEIVPCRGRATAWLGCRTGREFALISRKDSAPGDSGGPVLEPIGDRWRLVGVLSRGLPGASTGEGGVYTRVDAASDWLIVSIRRLARSP